MADGVGARHYPRAERAENVHRAAEQQEGALMRIQRGGGVNRHLFPGSGFGGQLLPPRAGMLIV